MHVVNRVFLIQLLLPSQFWPIPSMSRRVINCAKLFPSHPFDRIKWIRQWAVDRDPVLTSTTSAKIEKTAINGVALVDSASHPQLRADIGIWTRFTITVAT